MFERSNPTLGSGSNTSVLTRDLLIKGFVQGVGFRPFLFRLASSLSLDGWVRNTPYGVQVRIQGPTDRLTEFVQQINESSPSLARIDSISMAEAPFDNLNGFQILTSDRGGECESLLLPDLVPCQECLDEVMDPANRRYRYPFTNCTNCGPRYSIVERLPYDRVATTMAKFRMCPACLEEYENPIDRRFHAQPNACPDCGPHVELHDSSAKRISQKNEAILHAAQFLRDGKIIALKGVGGFQLLVDARSNEAVHELRLRKRRPDKPLAVMFPDLIGLTSVTHPTEDEIRLLMEIGGPIVLVRHDNNGLSKYLAPDLDRLGVFLPSSPLHYLLLREIGFPVVATSGNLSEEPICVENNEAFARLSSIADFFLVHNRPIVRPLDDSVFAVAHGLRQPLRLARGYAPFSHPHQTLGRNGLAVGGHLKNTICLTTKAHLHMSQHLGDLDSRLTLEHVNRSTNDLLQLFQVDPVMIMHDLHPDYASTKIAQDNHYSRPQLSQLVGVQHHHAHIVSCMAESTLTGEVLGVSWDGTGCGTDGALWGGEFLMATPDHFTRFASLLPFPLPGGDAAIREPVRSAFGALSLLNREGSVNSVDIQTLLSLDRGTGKNYSTMIERGLNAPLSSSVGRLFDAVSAILGLRSTCTYEGQAAMMLEDLAMQYAVRHHGLGWLEAISSNNVYSLSKEATGKMASDSNPIWLLDWRPMMKAVLTDQKNKKPVDQIAYWFHMALLQGMLEVVLESCQKRVVLSGGCFQNKILLEGAIHHLRKNGCDVYWNQLVPPNDGGLSFGQAYAAVHRRSKGVS